LGFVLAEHDQPQEAMAAYRIELNLLSSCFLKAWMAEIEDLLGDPPD
jgi:hypothetical protein